MTRVTKKDVWCLIDSLNQKYGLDDTTPCKFYLLEAYGGCQIVLKKKGSGSVTDITYGDRKLLMDIFDDVVERVSL